MSELHKPTYLMLLGRLFGAGWGSERWMPPHINRGSEVVHNISFYHLVYLLCFDRITLFAVVVFGTSLNILSVIILLVHPGPCSANVWASRWYTRYGIEVWGKLVAWASPSLCNGDIYWAWWGVTWMQQLSWNWWQLKQKHDGCAAPSLLVQNHLHQSK